MFYGQVNHHMMQVTKTPEIIFVTCAKGKLNNNTVLSSESGGIEG